MLLDDAIPTQAEYSRSLEQAASAPIHQAPGAEANTLQSPEPDAAIDPYVQQVIGATSGILYASLVGKLPRYPIPELRLPDGAGQLFLELGCNWGRWSLSAARRGYLPIGIDPNLDAVRAAVKVARQLALPAKYLVADARYLPFPPRQFDVVFSYSVLQHFSKPDVRTSLAETARVLRTSGTALIQIANAYGARSLYHQAKRGFREPTGFEVRYWTLRELRESFLEIIGPTTLSVDGFFGLGIQKSDLDLLSPKHRMVVYVSELLRRATDKLPPLINLADSIYVESVRSA